MALPQGNTALGHRSRRGADADSFVLHIWGALAELERKMISKCTKAGLAAYVRGS